jgi:hypothetical protein
MASGTVRKIAEVLEQVFARVEVVVRAAVPLVESNIEFPAHIFRVAARQHDQMLDVPKIPEIRRIIVNCRRIATPGTDEKLAIRAK